MRFCSWLYASACLWWCRGRAKAMRVLAWLVNRDENYHRAHIDVNVGLFLRWSSPRHAYGVKATSASLATRGGLLETQERRRNEQRILNDSMAFLKWRQHIVDRYSCTWEEYLDKLSCQRYSCTREEYLDTLRSQMWKNPGKLRAWTYGTKSPSRSEALLTYYYVVPRPTLLIQSFCWASDQAKLHPDWGPELVQIT